MDATYDDYTECKHDFQSQVEAIFRRLLSDGGIHYLGEASALVEPDCDLDRRCLGSVTLRMEMNGEIELAGFENSNKAPRRLWRAVDPSRIYRRGRAS